MFDNMKEVKYIPGDLVIFKTPFESSSTCVGIVKFLGNISDIVLLCPYTDLNLEYFIKVENIQGIPLTPEILEKNGWEKSDILIDEDEDEHHLYENKKNLLNIMYVPESKRFLPFIGNQHMLTFFKYVHQLQHLLFGLGLSMDLKV